MRNRLPVAAILATLAALSLPGMAHADCDPALSTEDALIGTRVAFVGTVTATEEGASWARFRVEEVWRGTLPELVEVQGMGRRNEVMEDDRVWRAQVRYLVVPYQDDGVLHDTICSGTVEWNADLAALRPADAHPPTDSIQPLDPSDPVSALPLLAVGLAIVVLVVAGALAFRSGRRTA
jgi:hypothetical protein